MTQHRDVDQYHLPVDAFGAAAPPEFFEILGRILAVNGKIEYLKARLGHLPVVETEGVKKVEQFLNRYESGRLDRNGIVHSNWVFGANAEDPEMILGYRYKTPSPTSGDIARVTISDIPGSARDQVLVQQSLSGLRGHLKRALDTMLIGEIAYTEVSLRWAAEQPPPVIS